MKLTLSVLLLIKGLASASPFIQQYYTTSSPLKQDSSVKVAAADDFSSCTCDLTQGGCDQACCCDPDCSADLVEQWRLNKNFCLDEINGQKILKSQQCFDRTLTAQIMDLQDGLKVYGKNIRSLFCITSSSSLDKVASFVDTQLQATDASSFNKTINERAVGRHLPAIDQNATITSSASDAIGYQTNEKLKAFYNRSDSVDGYFQDKQFMREGAGFYGQCERQMPLQFMINQKTEECGLIAAVMDNQYCANELSPMRNAFNFVFSADGSMQNLTTLLPGIQKKFSLNDFKEIQLAANEKGSFQESQFSASDCSCDNILLEAHYTVYFEDFDSNHSTNFKITNVTVDVVYGKLTPASCSSKVQLSRKSSWTFKQSIYSRVNVGGPGFILGAGIPVGTLATADANSYINATRGGMEIRGADNKGECYSVKMGLAGQNATSYKIETIREQLYYQDPLIGFGQNAVYGCKVPMNKDELRSFCNEKRWLNLMLFNNDFTDKYMAIFGNANPHFVQDWVQIETDIMDKTSSKAEWIESQATCNFPPVAFFIKIYYAKIFTKDEPQYHIVKVKKLLDQKQDWTFKRPDETLKQDFVATFTVQFFEVDQTAALYTPKTPNPFRPLARNILYPFIYGDALQSISLSVLTIAVMVAGIFAF